MNYKERFILKYKEEPNGCWIWNGALFKTGYGSFWFDGQNRLAHRISYQIYIDQNLNDKHVLHKCDNRKCVNPIHLFLGTELDNHRDKVIKGRSARGIRNGSAKLTDKDVIEIRILYPVVKSMRKLCDMYNVTRTAIRRVVRYTGWKHVA